MDWQALLRYFLYREFVGSADSVRWQSFSNRSRFEMVTTMNPPSYLKESMQVFSFQMSFKKRGFWVDCSQRLT